MRLTDRQLLGLPVVTQAGQPVGSVIGFESDTEHHTIETYLVSTNPLITRIFGLQRRTLAIARSQVISITDESMVVYDGIVTASQATTGNLTIAAADPVSAVTPTSLE